MKITGTGIPLEVTESLLQDKPELVIDFAKSYEETGGWYGINLFDLATKNGSINTLKALSKHYPNGNWNVFTFDLKDIIRNSVYAPNAVEVLDFLFKEIERRNLIELKSPKTYMRKFDLNEYRESLLELTIQYKRMDILEYLLDNGARISLVQEIEDIEEESTQWLDKYIVNRQLQNKLENKNLLHKKTKI